MIRRPPRSTPKPSSAASDVYKRQGKVCHTRCAIYHLAGDCIFPREGIFAVVLQEGTVRAGDEFKIVSIGDGTCAYSPDDAIREVEAARLAGTL